MNGPRRIKCTFFLISLFWILPRFISAQETCEPNYSIPHFTRNDVALPGKAENNQYNVMLTVGQPFIATATNYSVNSIAMGYWSPYLKEPRPPIVRASDGDFQDMILVEWTVEDDRTGPPVTGDMVTLYRNGYTLTTLPITQTDYQDFNVFPGEYYVYGVTSSNNMGNSHTDDNIGFMNPNGVITGQVETPSGNPVIDTKVTLTPNLGRSAFFDGNNYIYYFDAQTSANRLFSGLEGNYTIETWFRSIHTQQQTIFAAVDSASTNHYILIELTDEGKVRWQHSSVAGGSSSEIVTVDVFTEDSEWHHVAVVFDNNDMTMYVDGAIVGHTTANGRVNDTVEIILGKRSPLESDLFFQGRMDDFRIWSEARTWADIRKHNDLTLSGEEWNLAAYWKFDEVEGDIIFDLTDNDNDGNICGIERDYVTAPVFVGALTDSVGNYAIKSIYYGDGITFTVTPHKETAIGRSLEFDGVNDYISFEAQRIDLTQGYTIEGWFKTAGESEQTIFTAVNPATGDDHTRLELQSNGTVKYTHGSSGSGMNRFDPGDNDRSISEVKQELNAANKSRSNSKMGDFEIGSKMIASEKSSRMAGTEIGSKIGSLRTGDVVFSNSKGKRESKSANSTFSRSTTSTEIVSSGTFNDEIWHHFAVTYDNTTMALYIDGETIGTASSADSIAILSEIVIARQAPEVPANYFDGYLDEIRIWNSARTYEQVGGTMNQTLEGDEYGLAHYWRINEGTGDLISDATGNLVTGTVQGALWSEDIPLNEVFTHIYEPESRQATVNNSNTAVDMVNFTDISMIAISGFVRYEGTACFQESVEILVNGESLLPPIYTDEDGKFIIELEPGSTGDLLSVVYEDHEFIPPFIELPMIITPITGLYFSDRVTRDVNGIVAGGTCQFPITPSQGQIKVTFRAINGCIEETIVPDVNTGMFEVLDLPPLIYQVTVDHPDPAINASFTGDTLSLEQSDGYKEFIYRAPLGVTITGLPDNSCPDMTGPDGESLPSLPLLEQFTGYEFDVNVFETYISFVNTVMVTNTCTGDSGTITIAAQITDLPDTTLSYADGTINIPFVVGSANILSGGDHPYQKFLQVVVEDESGRSASDIKWVYVLGDRPRTESFTTTSPELPLYILRDPPGDASYSFLQKDSTITNTISFAATTMNNKEGHYAVHLGLDIDMSVGLLVSKSTKIDFTADQFGSFSMSSSTSNGRDLKITTTTSELFSTADDEVVTGEQGDVFVGGAINIAYGATDTLGFNGCQLEKGVTMRMAPEGFETFYIYTMGHILNSVIPSLHMMVNFYATTGDNPDSVRIYSNQIDVWNQVLDQNKMQKEAAVFDRNISFDGASGGYESSLTLTIETVSFFDTQIEINTNLGFELGMTIDGLGTTGGANFSFGSGTTYGQQTGVFTESTIGFMLDDDDVGDYFSVDIKKDNIYGTPVFELVGGSTSCPWEPNTIKRQLASLSIDPALAVNIPPDEPSIHTVIMGNASESGDLWIYTLSLLNETNPYGAVPKVNGVRLAGGGINFEIPAGEVITATLTIERGPEEYDYDGLTIELAPPCEVEIADAIGADDVQNAALAEVSVHYLVPCSESHIAVPEDNWLITAADEGDTLWVTVDAYDRLDENLDRIELQYRQALGGGALASPGNDYKEFTYPVALFENSEVEAIVISKKSNIEYLITNNEDRITNNEYLITKNEKRITNIGGRSDQGAWKVAVADAVAGSKQSTVQNSAIPALPAGRRNPKSAMGSGDWFVAYTVPKNELIDDYVLMPWNISPSIVIDGAYELRAKAICTGELVPGTSPVVTGLIDRLPPQVLGAPEPAGGILAPDDEISITFNEDVECGEINVGAGDIMLFNTVTGNPVDFTYTCGGNIIVIDPNIQNYFIENQTLRAELHNIQDLYGNTRSADEPVQWEFFVNRNPIEWVGSNIENIFIFLDEEYSTTRQLINNGGSNRSWDIIGGREGALPSGNPLNLPSWLEVTPMSGTLTPGSSQDVEISLVQGLNFGEYGTTIYAAGTMGDEPMIIDIRKLCYPPAWWVDPTQYQNTMTITATLSTDGELSDDIYDVIGVFVGEEVRGVANVEYVPELDGLANTHPYEVFLTVYSNEPSDEALSIRVWDASECVELGMVEEEYTFESNAVLGTPTSPATITATSQIIQTVGFHDGWTWFSLNLESSDMSVNSVLNNLSPANGDLIKSQTTFDQYVAGAGWVGTLDTLENEPMYQIRLSGADTLQMIGYAVDVEKDTVYIISGWNWIGYLPQLSMDVDVALMSLEAAATGDLIKSQFTFAQFVEGLGWIGSLKFMNPKLGFLLKALNPGELVYPFEIPPVLAKGTTQLMAENAPDWTVIPTDYEFNMTVTGVVSVEGEPSRDEMDMVGAFVSIETPDGIVEECRGVAQPMYIEALDQYLVFLMVYSNDTEEETVEFRFFDASEDYTWNISESIEFEPNLMSGTVEEPFAWNTYILGIGDPNYIPDEFSLGQNFPNPFNPITKIGYGLPEESSVKLIIYNILGREVRSWQWQRKEAGYHFVTWDARDNFGRPIGAGIYLYRIVAGDFIQVKKMVLLK